MTGFVADKLQAAVFAALSADVTLSAMVTDVYDEPIVGAVMPYVAFGETKTKPFDTKNSVGADTNFTVEIWSDDPGHMEAKEIMAQVDEVLHQADLILDGHSLMFLFMTEASVKREQTDTSDNYKGVLSYRAVSTQP